MFRTCNCGNKHDTLIQTVHKCVSIADLGYMFNFHLHNKVLICFVFAGHPVQELVDRLHNL